MKRQAFICTVGRVPLIQLLILCVCVSCAIYEKTVSAQALSAGPSTNLHGVLSKAQLSPALHSRLRALRFSLDGRYILLQDESTVYVLTHSPLAIQLYFPARLALPIRFSSDSSEIVVATRELGVQRWSIATGKSIDIKKLGAEKDCLLATLSPQGNFYACVGLHWDLHVFRVSSGEEIFAAQIGEDLGPNFHALQPFHFGLPFSEPFGYYVGEPAFPPLDRVATATSLQFSPDEHYLLAFGLQRGLTVVDLQERKKIKVAGSLKHGAEQGSLEFISPERVVSVDPSKANDSVLLSFPDGQIVDKLDIAGSPTSDPRYLVHVTHDAKDAELFDLQAHKSVSTVSRDGADIFGGDVVSYSIDTGVTLSHLGEAHPRIRGRVPPGALPLLQTALASPSLETLALGISGQGAVFRVATGAQIASFAGLRGAWFNDDREAVLRVPEAGSLTSTLESMDLGTGKTQNLWSREDVYLKNESLFSGPVLLSEVVREIYLMIDQHRMGYELRPLDMRSGKTLWSRDFGGSGPRTGYAGDPPVTFTDPQGDRVVVGWPAKSDGAHAAAKHIAAVKQAMKDTKVFEHNSVFEVLDARTGNTVGAAFVPQGAGPESYTSAFSEGDWLILVKDGVGITAVSLSTGTEQLRLTALVPSISAESGLLSAAQDGGRLLIYDLKTGARRDNYTFPVEILYSRFSADGKRLLVLTEDQMVYVLDVTAAAAPAAATSP